MRKARAKVKPAGKPRGTSEVRRPNPGGRQRPPTRPRPPLRPGVTKTWKKTDQALEYAIHLFKEQYSPGERARMIAKLYSCDESTARRWMAEALELLRANQAPTDESIIELREQTRLALDETYRDAKAAGDYTARVAAQRERAKIFGLHAPLEVKVGGGITVTGEVLDRRSVDLRAELVALTEAARAIAAGQPVPDTVTQAGPAPIPREAIDELLMAPDQVATGAKPEP